MKIAFVGCVQFSADALQVLLDHPAASVVGVITRRTSPINADFVDLAPQCAQADVPCVQVEGNDQGRLLAALQDWAPDIVYCFGWSYLLDRHILEFPPLGVVGFHPAALPANRGRHPIIWALALGLRETASSFFLMTEEADAGPLISQQVIAIDEEDDAGSLYARITRTAQEQVREFTHALAAGQLDAVPQDSARANLWRKRTPADGLIDWRMPARGIVNLVRALAAPYPGADCSVNGSTCKVWRARVHANAVATNLEPGRVLAVTAGTVTVKCGDGAVELIEHTLSPLPPEGSYL